MKRTHAEPEFVARARLILSTQDAFTSIKAKFMENEGWWMQHAIDTLSKREAQLEEATAKYEKSGMGPMDKEILRPALIRYEEAVEMANARRVRCMGCAHFETLLAEWQRDEPGGTPEDLMSKLF